MLSTDIERPACEIDPTAGGQAQPTFKRIARGSPHGHARINPLFTMSDNTRHAAGHWPNDGSEFKYHGRVGDGHADRRPAFAKASAGNLRTVWLANRSCEAAKVGGARRDRTDDLLLAKQALSQLSYGPFRDQASAVRYQERLGLIPDT